MRRWCGAAMVAALLVWAGGAFGAPASPFSLTVLQPDGTRIVLQQRGDEFRNWTRTPEGDTVVRHPVTGVWEYAVLSRGRLVPSGVKVRPGASAPAASRNLTPPQGAAQAREAWKLSRGTTWTLRPISGTRKILVIRVGFTDQALKTDPSFHQGAFFGDADSVKKYYADQSEGNLSITSARGGTGVMSLNLGAEDANEGKHPGVWINTGTDDEKHANEVAFVTSVVKKAEAAGVDFASFDANRDGKITPEELCVYLIVAGYEESGSKLTPSVWAHAWLSWLEDGADHVVTVGGKTLTDWAMNGEYYATDVPMPFGVIAHELGHQFCGLPDLYDTAKKNEGLGSFSIMAGGSWGTLANKTPGSKPVNLDAWSRQYLGWETPDRPTRGTVTLGTPDGTHRAVKLLGSGHRDTEYFLVEVRALTGWDAGLGGFVDDDDKSVFDGFAGGLLILHVDEEVGAGSLAGGNDFNTYAAGKHQGCMAVEADGPHLSKTDGTATSGSGTTLWYSGNKDDVGDGTFTETSNPSSAFYGGTASGVRITGISVGGTTMTCEVTASSSGVTPSVSPRPTEEPLPTEDPSPTGASEPTPGEDRLPQGTLRSQTVGRVTGERTRGIGADPLGLQRAAEIRRLLLGDETAARSADLRTSGEEARRILEGTLGVPVNRNTANVAVEPLNLVEGNGTDMDVVLDFALRRSTAPGVRSDLFLALPVYRDGADGSREMTGFLLLSPPSGDEDDRRSFSFDVDDETGTDADEDQGELAAEYYLVRVAANAPAGGHSSGGCSGLGFLPLAMLLVLPLGLLRRR